MKTVKRLSNALLMLVLGLGLPALRAIPAVPDQATLVPTQPTLTTLTHVSSPAITMTAGYKEFAAPGTWDATDALAPNNYSGVWSPATAVNSPWTPPAGGYWVDPSTDSTLTGSGAVWVSTTAANIGEDHLFGPGAEDEYRLFNDSFDIPAGAINVSADIWVSGDNAFAVYLNDASQVIGTTEPGYTVYGEISPSQYGSMPQPFPFETVTHYTFTPAAGQPNNVLFVVRNWPADGGMNPTALVYKLVYNYEMPITPPSGNVTTLTLLSSANTMTAGYKEFAVPGTWDVTDALDPNNYSIPAWSPATVVSPPWTPTAGLWVDPSTDPTFAGSGAVWVSTTAANYGEDDLFSVGVEDEYRLFNDSFDIPAGAINVSADIWVSGDNAFTVYLNDANQVIGTTEPGNTVYGAIEPSQYDSCRPWPYETVNHYAFTPLAGQRNNVLFVVRNWPASENINPTGLLYGAVITYETPTTYTINVTAAANGSIAPGTATVNSGASQTFTITPNTGYYVADVLVDGASVGAVTSYPFSNVTANHTIAASFAINTYTLTYLAGLNGSITGTTPQTVNYGGSGNPVTAVPATGYHFVNWDDGSTANPRTDANVTAMISVTANFAINTYTVTASAGSNGSITPSGAMTVNYGAGQTFTITPSTGYHVADVLVDGASVGAVTSYPFSNVTANHTIAASFAINTYTVTASAGSNGSITPSGAITVNYGASQTFTIAPSTGYHVADVSVDGVSVGAVPTYTFNNVTANHTIAASFAINTYTLTYTAGAHGSITGTTPQTVNYGGSGSPVTAVPATGYHFVNWNDGLTANPRTDANVRATISVTANFAINTYTLTYTAGAHGSITGTTPQTVNYGGSGNSVTAVPATGYHFVNWGDGSTANPRADANVRATISVTANFAINTCTVTASAGSNGSITPSGAITVNYGASQTFTITANTGYHVADVSVDGLSVGAVTSYTFSNVTAKHTIAASFAINLCALGDFVWSDVKGNGIQDAGEPGIQGVTVKLFKCGDKQATATPAAIATTDASGKYSFLNLMPGSYFIVFVNPDGNKYSGFTTRSAPGSTPANDSNAYADGHTDCVTLAPGATDSTIDAGLIPKRGITIVKTASKTQVAPGEAVTYTYVVANTGGVTLTGLTIVDDNGTPTVTRDDITVGSVASLDPGKSVSLTRTLVPAVTICDNNGGGCGLLITEHLSNGTTRFTFLQSRNGRDNYQTFSGWLGTRSYAHCAKIRVYDKSGLTYQDLDGTPGPGDVSGYFNSFSVVTSTASVVMKDGTSVNMPNICYKKGWNNDWHNDWDRAGNRAHFWDDDYVGHILDWDFNAHPSTCSGKVTNIAKVTASGGSVTVTATDDATVKIVK